MKREGKIRSSNAEFISKQYSLYDKLFEMIKQLRYRICVSKDEAVLCRQMCIM